MENYNLEIIGVGTIQSQDRTTLRIPIDYLENGIELSTALYVSQWRYNNVATNSEFRELIHNELVKQKELVAA